jgi:hypothetical protein
VIDARIADTDAVSNPIEVAGFKLFRNVCGMRDNSSMK